MCQLEIEAGLRLSLRFFSPSFRRRRFPGTKDGFLLGSTSLLLFGESEALARCRRRLDARWRRCASAAPAPRSPAEPGASTVLHASLGPNSASRRGKSLTAAIPVRGHLYERLREVAFAGRHYNCVQKKIIRPQPLIPSPILCLCILQGN